MDAWLPAEPAPADELVALPIGSCDPTDRHVGVRLVATGEVSPDLDDVEFEESVLDGVGVDEGRITRLSLVSCACRTVSAVAVDLSDSRAGRVTVEASRLAGCTLDGATWEDVAWTDVRAARLSARQATWRRVTFTGCDLTALDLTGAVLDRVRFSSCTLVGAVFADARLRDVQFERCELSGAHDVGSLRGATVDPETLTSLTGPMAAALGIRLRRG